MPPHDPGADREAELAALQTAFDEYIASSRELEDELDAELAKMRKSFSTLFAVIPMPPASFLSCCFPVQCLLVSSSLYVWALICWYSAILI